jgi:hypothetical protein
MNFSAKSELLKRLSPAPHAGGLKTAIEGVFALGSMIDSAKKRAADDPNLSEAGRAAYVAKVAIDNVNPLLGATKAARKMARFNADRKASLKPATPLRDDLVGELRRQELRAFARSLPMVDRLPFALEHSEAILDAPPALSGLPADQYSRVRESYIAAKFGPEIREIEVLDEDLSIVKAAHDLALNELRANAGMGEQSFSKLVENSTRETDGV